MHAKSITVYDKGRILNGEVLLNWRGLTNGTALDASYKPDWLDDIPVSACAVGMIYSFYGRLSVSMNDVETLRSADLPPAFYCWGTRDSFAGQFTRNANAVEEAGCRVERKVLEGYPHGYGSGGNPSVWGNDFDAFLTSIMSPNSGIDAASDCSQGITKTEMYDIRGNAVNTETTGQGIYILRDSTGVHKTLITK